MQKKAERLEKIDYDKFSITDKNGKKVISFVKCMNLDIFARRIFYGSISLKEAEEMQDKMELEIKKLKSTMQGYPRERIYAK